MEIKDNCTYRNIDEIIIHSIEISVSFYQHIGYKIIESSYLLFGETPHYLMVKYLKDEN